MPSSGSVRNAPLEDRYIPEPNCGCWLWLRSTDHRGYGRVRVAGKNRPAHRLFYEQKFGAIPVGLELDHKCRVRCCVNPDHLEAVTPKENKLRGSGVGAVNSKKTHCPQGHEYTVDNTYFNRGRRLCRRCTLDRQRRARNAVI